MNFEYLNGEEERGVFDMSVATSENRTRNELPKSAKWINLEHYLGLIGY
jgi:hypothetical protein